MNKEIRVSLSDDYSVLTVGKFEFYYGYEVTTGVDENDEDAEWCFTVEISGKEVMRLPTSVLSKSLRNSDEATEVYLIAGLAEFLKKYGSKIK